MWKEAMGKEAMGKKGDAIGSQPTPTMAMYTEAMDKFAKSSTAFIQHMHLLNEARDAYQSAMTASTALRNDLDAGDQVLRSLMAQLEQEVAAHLGVAAA
jgi:hypothetical protein